MNYKNIYKISKRDYITLKNMQMGGKVSRVSANSRNNNKMIIHISGPSGAGKTTLGDKLKEKFNDKIVVKDIDHLREDFEKEYYYYGNKEWTIIDKDAYQKYIDKYVSKQNKPIIFVGLNNMPWWHKNHYYDMHSNHNYYIKIDDATIIKQKCLRTLETFSNNLSTNKIAMDNLINNNKWFIKSIKEEIDEACNEKGIVKMNKKWDKDYKKQGYIFLSSDDIFKKVSAILNETLEIKKSK